MIGRCGRSSSRRGGGGGGATTFAPQHHSIIINRGGGSSIVKTENISVPQSPKHFWDPKKGRLFSSTPVEEPVLFRGKKSRTIFTPFYFSPQRLFRILQ